MIGSTLAHYEILDELGRGGMGVVYRARDTKLGREVAIKVLPAELAEDSERLSRFEREAKLLAQLNHPGIATLHGFEKVDGTPFLVMELVEGETLAERIARGPIPWDEARALFTQIAEAIEAAHGKGVLHRDLKPANIKITPDGRIKILDFGLAKALQEDDIHVESSQSPTRTRGTALGAILGTASYMSPEQARGKELDRRTDIWAFGCCLYEALTGRKVFDGETVSDIFVEVLKGEPDWGALPPTAPVRGILRRCLEKEPRRRLRDIGDMGLAMAGTIIQSSGMGLFQSPNHSAILSTVEPSKYGVVAGLTQLMRNSANLTSVALSTALVTGVMAFKGYPPSLDAVTDAPGAFTSGLQVTFLTMGGAGVLGMVVSFLKGERPAEIQAPASSAQPSGSPSD